MSYTKEIFNLLKVQPYEDFYIVNTKTNESQQIKYHFNNNLEIYYHTEYLDDKSKDYTVEDILNGKCKIVKIPPKLSNNEKIVVEYARLCGYNWLAKDENGDIFAYALKPEKIINSSNEAYWDSKDDRYIEISYDLNFLSYENDEPYYIGN